VNLKEYRSSRRDLIRRKADKTSGINKAMHILAICLSKYIDKNSHDSEEFVSSKINIVDSEIEFL
jgi:hypothetical protein